MTCCFLLRVQEEGFYRFTNHRFSWFLVSVSKQFTLPCFLGVLAELKHISPMPLEDNHYDWITDHNRWGHPPKKQTPPKWNPAWCSTRTGLLFISEAHIGGYSIFLGMGLIILCWLVQTIWISQPNHRTMWQKIPARSWGQPRTTDLFGSILISSRFFRVKPLFLCFLTTPR